MMPFQGARTDVSRRCLRVRFWFLAIAIAIGIGIDARSFHVRTALLAISIAIPIAIWTPPTQDWAPCRDLVYRCHYNLQAR